MNKNFFPFRIIRFVFRALVKLVFFLILIAIIFIVQDFVTIKPFRFESFDNSEEAKEYINTHYPPRSDAKILMNHIKFLGGDCWLQDKKELPVTTNKSDKMYYCNYLTNTFSKSPFLSYDIWLHTDQNDVMIELDSLYVFGSLS